MLGEDIYETKQDNLPLAQKKQAVQSTFIHFKSPGEGIIFFVIFLKQQSIFKFLISDVMHQ